MPDRTDARKLDTFAKLLRHNAEIYANKAAIREKDLGIWQSWTWSQVFEEVRALAIGLKLIGLDDRDRVAIIGDNRPWAYWTMVAAQSIGAIPVPVYQDSVADEIAYLLDHAGIKVAVVEDQEQVDKLLEISDRVPSLKDIVYADPRGLKNYDHTHLHKFDELQVRGRAQLEKQPRLDREWLEFIEASKGSDDSVILYTSGTTGKPKGVVLTHDNVIITARNANAFDKLTDREEILAYLPMAWVGDHIFSYGQAYAGGFCVSCPESPETGLEDRREIGPTFFFAPPRVFENLLTTIMVRMEDAGAFKRKIFHYFLAVARQHGEDILNGKPVGPAARLHYSLGNLLVYGPLKNRMGFSRLRTAYTAGEAIGPEIFKFYRALGINLKQLYGQTEAAVYITMQPDGDIHADTVGPPAPQVELRFTETGEVDFRSPGGFKRYYKNDNATKSTKTTDGWVHTGDAGFLDERGHLKIIDRAKDVGKLNDGTLFAPKYIENKLKFFPNIKEAVAFGHDRDYSACFINIELTSVGNWAERNNVAYASYQELAALHQVYKMIEEHVGEVNRSLAQEPQMAGAQIKRFLILHKELDADDGELTRTQKVRRMFLAERYGPLITALYDGSATQHIETEVTFEDGRKGIIAADVKIVDMETYPVSGQLREAAE